MSVSDLAKAMQEDGLITMFGNEGERIPEHVEVLVRIPPFMLVTVVSKGSLEQNPMGPLSGTLESMLLVIAVPCQKLRFLRP